MQFIDLKKQYALMKHEIQVQINDVLDSGQYILGNKVTQLETQLAEFVGVKHCIGVADGTKAILIALMALELEPGDEVIVPDFTFIATASMVALLGAIPVFVDVDPNTYNLDPELIEQAITPKTKVIIPVSLFGQCADLTAINKIAEKHNLAVIEDAAQSFGARQNNVMSCNLSTISCTSFFPSKPLGCYGDGGACFTKDDKLAIKMRQIRIHGQDKRYHHAILGVNGRLDELQAAILIVKLKFFNEEVKLREKIGARYTELLKDTSCITPHVAEGNSHVYAQYALRVENRDELITQLNQVGIPTAIHYPIPLHKQPALSKFYKGQKLNQADLISKQIFSIPMHPYLDTETQDLIVASVKQYY